MSANRNNDSDFGHSQHYGPGQSPLKGQGLQSKFRFVLISQHLDPPTDNIQVLKTARVVLKTWLHQVPIGTITHINLE